MDSSSDESSSTEDYMQRYRTNPLYGRNYGSASTVYYNQNQPLEDDGKREPEKEILKEIRDSKYDALVEGDPYYLISLGWFKKWETYLSHLRYPRPSEIDNSRLHDHEGNLKSTISERFDYMIINEEQWTKLHDIYGGGPVISKPCLKSSLGKLFVEVKPLTLKLIRSTELDTTYSTHISKIAKLGDLLTTILDNFTLERENIKIWLYSSGRKYKRLKNINKHLDQLGIYSGQTLLVEERKENGKWPSSNFYRRAESRNRRYYSVPTEPGKTGLQNLGNTCFMNSSLQCLSAVAPLTDFFLNGTYKDDLNITNPLSTGGLLAEEYKKLLEGIWSPSTGCVEPYDFKRTLCKFADQFSGWNQHDSQELLIYLLDKLHEDVNRVDSKPYVEVKESNGRDDIIVAQEAWEGHKLRDNSVFVDLFHGQLKSTVTCPDCSKKSITFDPFMYLSVPIPTNNDRFVELTLYRQDPSLRPMKLKLKTSDTDVIYSLKKQLAQLTDIEGPENITILDDYENIFYSEFRSTARVRDILPDDRVAAFEHPETEDSDDSDEEERDVRIIIYNTTDQYSQDFFGQPLFITVKNSLNYEGLYKEILKHVKRYLKIEAPEDKELFQLVPVSMKGKVLGYSLDRTLPSLSIEDASGIALLWSEEDAKNNYDISKINDVELHSSCSITKKKTSGVDLDDCFTLFTQEEQLGKMDTWYCNKCEDHMQAFKKFDIWSAPPVLIIHLKRFSEAGGMWRSKLDASIDFPVEDFDISNFVLNPEQTNLNYELIAVSNHFGSMGGGHYTAYMKHRNGGWYECDDSSVSALHGSPVTSAGYVLFYKRKDLEFSTFDVPEPEEQKEESSSESGSSDSEGPTFVEEEPTYRVTNRYMPTSSSEDSVL